MKWLCTLALAISLIALGLSVWTWQQADARTEAAIEKWERARSLPK